MSIWIRNVGQHLVVSEGMSREALEAAVAEVDGYLRCFFDEDGSFELVDYEGSTFPNGEMHNGYADDVERIVALFAPGSSVTFYDEDDGAFYDCRRLLDGTVQWRVAWPDREHLFGDD